jgi:hypothetical protein
MIFRRFFLQSTAAATYFALAIVGAPTPSLSQTIDQKNVGPVATLYADLNKGNGFELLESFTAGVTGTLDKVALPLYEDQVYLPNGKAFWYNSNATVTILTMLNGKWQVLGATIIGQASIPHISSSAIKQDVFDVNASFPLSGTKAVSVTSGHLYYIAVQADTPVPPSDGGNGLDWFATVDDYSRGDQYVSYGGKLCPLSVCGDSYDLEFRTYVTRGSVRNFVTPTGGSSAPEPSTWAMMLVGFSGLAFAGYRASRRSASAAAH